MLDICPIGQDEPLWCWAACAEMVLRYFDLPLDQGLVASSWVAKQGGTVCGQCTLGRSARAAAPCCDGQPECCRIALSPVESTPDLLKMFGVEVCCLGPCAKDAADAIEKDQPVLEARENACGNSDTHDAWPGSRHMRVCVGRTDDALIFVDPNYKALKTPNAWAAAGRIWVALSHWPGNYTRISVWAARRPAEPGGPHD